MLLILSDEVPCIYAMDASEKKVAICSTILNSELVHPLYNICRTKGAYTRLHSRGGVEHDVDDNEKGILQNDAKRG